VNYSIGSLHIIGTPAALDKFQFEIARHALTVLYETDRYAARCSDCFGAVRQLPGYLKISFRTQEGCVPSRLAYPNDVLIEDSTIADDQDITENLARSLGIETIRPHRTRASRFALLPDVPITYVTEPAFRAIFALIAYLTADPQTGKYEKDAKPAIGLAFLIAGAAECRQLINVTADEDASSAVDYVLTAADSDGLVADINRIASHARWQRDPGTVALLPKLQEEARARLSTVPGGMVSSWESLSAVLPCSPRFRVVPQHTAPENRLVRLLTWSDESVRYMEEHAYLIVQSGSENGLYHPPVAQDEFLRAVVTINNYLAAEVVPAEADGYPQRLDISTLDAEARAEAIKRRVQSEESDRQ
jgi:hypothetical protein